MIDEAKLDEARRASLVAGISPYDVLILPELIAHSGNKAQFLKCPIWRFDQIVRVCVGDLYSGLPRPDRLANEILTKLLKGAIQPYFSESGGLAHYVEVTIGRQESPDDEALCFGLAIIREDMFATELETVYALTDMSVTRWRELSASSKHGWTIDLSKVPFVNWLS